MVNRKLVGGILAGIVFGLAMMILATQPSYAWELGFQNCNNDGTWCWSIQVPIQPGPTPPYTPPYIPPYTPPYTPDYGHGHGYDWHRYYNHYHHNGCVWGSRARGLMDTGQTVHVDADYHTGITHMIVKSFWSFRRQTFSCVIDPNTPGGVSYHCTPVPW